MEGSVEKGEGASARRVGEDDEISEKEEEIDVGTRGGQARDGVGGTGVARVENGHQDDEIDSISFHYHSTTTKTREWRDIV